MNEAHIAFLVFATSLVIYILSFNSVLLSSVFGSITLISFIVMIHFMIRNRGGYVVFIKKLKEAEEPPRPEPPPKKEADEIKSEEYAKEKGKLDAHAEFEEQHGLPPGSTLPKAPEAQKENE